MNREQTREAAQVMLAYADGKTVECCRKNLEHGAWFTMSDLLAWDWLKYKFRVVSDPEVQELESLKQRLEDKELCIKNLGLMLENVRKINDIAIATIKRLESRVSAIQKIAGEMIVLDSDLLNRASMAIGADDRKVD